jgi:hypothetical protein
MAKNNTSAAKNAVADTNGDIPDSLEGINLRMNAVTDDVSTDIFELLLTLTIMF